MKHKKYLFSLVTVLLILFLSACTISGQKQSPDPNSTAAPATAGETTYPLKVKDFMGREVVIEKSPQRIVSLSPSTTEILFALNVGERVVGITNYDDYPPEVLDLPKIGNFKGPNIEAIVQQKPDIIFASNLTGNEQIEVLEKAGFTTVMLQANSIDQIMKSISIIGCITDSQEQAYNIVQGMKDKITEVGNRTKDLPKVKVYYIVSYDGNWTTGSGTFIDELITLSGGENVAGDMNGWVKYSLEMVVEKNPDIIISFPHAGDISNLPTQPGFKETNAVKNSKIFLISDKNLVSRPSNRIILGLEEIAKYLHPEAFK